MKGFYIHLQPVCIVFVLYPAIYLWATQKPSCIIILLSYQNFNNIVHAGCRRRLYVCVCLSVSWGKLWELWWSLCPTPHWGQPMLQWRSLYCECNDHNHIVWQFMLLNYYYKNAININLVWGCSYEEFSNTKDWLFRNFQHTQCINDIVYMHHLVGLHT